MSHDQTDQVSEILQARCGLLTIATLSSGKTIRIHNIAWGRDMGESFDHITTNISPNPSESHTVDVFTTDKVTQLLAPESDTLLYRKAADEA